MNRGEPGGGVLLCNPVSEVIGLYGTTTNDGMSTCAFFLGEVEAGELDGVEGGEQGQRYG